MADIQTDRGVYSTEDDLDVDGGWVPSIYGYNAYRLFGIQYPDGKQLAGRDLRHAYLAGAWLHGADLRGADLGGADLRGAHLSGVDLRGANVLGANFGHERDGDMATMAGVRLRRCYDRECFVDGRGDETREWLHANLPMPDGRAIVKRCLMPDGSYNFDLCDGEVEFAEVDEEWVELDIDYRFPEGDERAVRQTQRKSFTVQMVVRLVPAEEVED
jgi:hypothetical protein